MKIINRTVRGIGLLLAAVAAFGTQSAEFAAQGGSVGMMGKSGQFGGRHSGAASQKRTAAKLRNKRARGTK